MVKWTYYLKLLIIAAIVCCAMEVGMILYSMNNFNLFPDHSTQEQIVNILVLVIPLLLWCLMTFLACRIGKKKHADWAKKHTFMAIGTCIGSIGTGLVGAYIIVAVLERIIK